MGPVVADVLAEVWARAEPPTTSIESAAPAARVLINMGCLRVAAP